VNVPVRKDEMMQQNEPWLSLEEIARHLGVSQDTVHRWIRTRALPAHKVGRLWKFQVSEVNEWVRAGKGGEDESQDDASA
jgi:excisionase family DNA binding protein